MKRISKMLITVMLFVLATLFLTGCVKKQQRALDRINLPSEIRSDLKLPEEENGFKLAWTSNREDYPVKDFVLKVPTRTSKDEVVDLTCTIESFSKSFSIKILAINPRINELLGKLTPASTVVTIHDKITLPLNIEEATVEWSELGGGQLLSIANGECEVRDKSVTETVGVEVQAKLILGEEVATTTIRLTFKVEKSDEDILTEVLEGANLSFASGETAEGVKTEVTLPTPTNDATFNWLSNNPNVIIADGKAKVNLDCFNEDTTVELTLEAKLHDVTKTKKFKITVLKNKLTDEQKVNNVLDATTITLDGIDPNTAVKKVVVNLPTKTFGVNITYEITGTSAISPAQVINIPEKTFTENTSVVLKVNYLLNGINKQKEFNFTILKNKFTDAEWVSHVLDNTTLKFAESETSTTVKTKVTIKTLDNLGSAELTYAVTNGLTVANNVITILDETFEADTEVTLTITCKQGTENTTKEFKFTVLRNKLTDEERVNKLIDSVDLEYNSGDSATSVTKNVKVTYTEDLYVALAITTDNSLITINGNIIEIPKKSFVSDTKVKVTIKASLNVVEKSVTREFTVKANVMQAELDIAEALGTLTEQTTKTDEIKLPKSVNGLTITWTKTATKVSLDEESDAWVVKYNRPSGDKQKYSCKATATINKDGQSGSKNIDLIFEYQKNDEEIVDAVLKSVPAGKKTLKADGESQEFPSIKNDVTITFEIKSSLPKNYGVIVDNKLKLSNTDITVDEVVTLKFTYKLNDVTKTKEVEYTFKATEMVTVTFGNLNGCTNESLFAEFKLVKGSKIGDNYKEDPYFADITKNIFLFWTFHHNSQQVNNIKEYKVWKDTTFNANWIEPMTNDRFLTVPESEMLLTTGIVYKLEEKGFYVYTSAGLFFVRTISDDGSKKVGSEGSEGLAKVNSLIWFQGYKIEDKTKREITLVKKDGTILDEVWWDQLQETLALPAPQLDLLTNEIITEKHENKIVKVNFVVNKVLTDQESYEFTTNSGITFKLFTKNDIVGASIADFKNRITNSGGDGIGEWEIICYSSLDSEGNLVFVPYQAFVIKKAYTLEEVVTNILDPKLANIINSATVKTTETITLLVSELGVTITYTDSDSLLTVNNDTAVIELTDKSVTEDVIIHLVAHFEKGGDTKDTNHNLKFTFVPTDEYYVGIAKNNLTLPASLNHSASAPATLTLPSTQDGVNVVWRELDAELFDFTTGQLKEPNIVGNVKVKLEATLSKNGATATKQFEVEFVLTADPDLVKLSQVAQTIKAGISTQVAHTEGLTGIVKEQDGVTITYSDDENLIDFDTNCGLRNTDITADKQVLVKMLFQLNGKSLNDELLVTFKYNKQWTVTISLEGGESDPALPTSYKVNDGDKLPTIDTTHIVHKTDHSKGAFLHFAKQGEVTAFNLTQAITQNYNLVAIYQELDEINTLVNKNNNDTVHVRGIIFQYNQSKMLLRDKTGFMLVEVSGIDFSGYSKDNEIILTGNVIITDEATIKIVVGSTGILIKANESYLEFVPNPATELNDASMLVKNNTNLLVKVVYNHTKVLTNEQATNRSLIIFNDKSLNLTNNYQNELTAIVNDTDFSSFWDGLKEVTSIGQYTLTFLYLTANTPHNGYLVQADFYSKTELPTEVQVAFVKESLTLPEEVEADQAINLISSIVNYDGVSIVWAETTVPQVLNLTTGLLLDTAITENKIVNLQATISKDSISQTKDFTVTIKPVSATITKVYSFVGLVNQTYKFEENVFIEDKLQMSDFFKVKNIKKTNPLNNLTKYYFAFYQKTEISFDLKDEIANNIVSIKFYFHKDSSNAVFKVNNHDVTRIDATESEPVVLESSEDKKRFTITHKKGKKIFVEKMEIVFTK